MIIPLINECGGNGKMLFVKLVTENDSTHLDDDYDQPDNMDEYINADEHIETDAVKELLDRLTGDSSSHRVLHRYTAQKHQHSEHGTQIVEGVMPKSEAQFYSVKLLCCWPSVDKKFPLLDVGSCYNPFSEFGEFHSVALDLQPATEKVYKCDFLKLEIVENQVASGLAASNSKTSNDTGGSKDSMMSSQENCQCLASNLITSKLNLPSDSSITHLPASSFQVVVFSLLLSYFPTPIQRWDCCLKAHQLLSVNGILIIITPDSSHQNRNAAMMKSWKLGIESLGFIRWKYVKQTHVHCMVFRKVSPCHTKDKTTKVLHAPEMLYTRQDYTGNDSDDSDSDGVKNNETRPEETDKELAKLFDELPAFD
ncbi:predicted protein [Nematostella vectensis]|uniref:S-adenosylmethionine sensor upstream of mTORC1 n=1 Tax=Nematostella vectensis TaxID=45351 RepID=A7SA21_NEMVE|nr:predicted protein [Nematostella vectensis]|eukprot:XP_001631446.1 predicted protein [Nematostella vectensis]